MQLVAGVRLDDIHTYEKSKEGTDTCNTGTDGDGRGLFAGAPEEVLEHSRVTFHCPARAGALFLLGQERIESPLPVGGRVSEVNYCVFVHLIPPSCPGGNAGIQSHSGTFSAAS